MELTYFALIWLMSQKMLSFFFYPNCGPISSPTVGLSVPSVGGAENWGGQNKGGKIEEHFEGQEKEQV